MNTAPRDACQSGSRPIFRRVVGGGIVCLLAGGFLWVAAGHARHPPPAPRVPSAPSLPAWQQELNAARLLEASQLISPASDPAEAAARDGRMSRLYRELADKYPDRAAVQKAFGEYEWRHERALYAMPPLLRASALDSADADTADLLASAELQLGRAKEATAQWQRAVRLAPDDPRYHFAYANALYLFRHELIEPPALPDEKAVLAAALEEFRRTAALAPRDLRYAKAYAETFYIVPQPDWEQARSAWSAVLALSGTDTDFANSHLARVSLRMKRPEEAETYLALIHGPDFASLKAQLRIQAAKLPPAGQLPAGGDPAAE